MSDYPRPVLGNPDYGQAAATAQGVRQLREQNAEVLAHLDATVGHLEAIAEEMRATSHQNAEMLVTSRWTLVAAILTLVATVVVSLFL